MEIEVEEWRAVGYPGYEVSNLGRVRSLDRWVDCINRRSFYKGKILKPCLDKAGYPLVKLPGKKSRPVHRLLAEAFLGATQHDMVDHIDGNPKNNCVLNLRVCSSSQNSGNKKIPNNNTSGFKGVYWHKRIRKWCARIGYRRKVFYLGDFESKHEAAYAYDHAARKFFGGFAKTNQCLGLLISKEIA